MFEYMKFFDAIILSWFVLAPLGLWKIVDIIIWIVKHLRWS